MAGSFVRRLACLPLALALFATASAAATPSYSVSHRIKAPDGGWDYVSFDPVRRRLYVSRAGGVTVINVDAGTVIGHLTDAGRAHASLPLENGALLLVTDSASNSAHLVDTATGARVAEIPTGQKPDAAVFDPASGLAVVMNGKSGDATLIDPVSAKVEGTVAIGGALESAAVDGRGRVFVNVEDQNQVAVLDARTGKLVGRYRLDGCQGPTGLAYAAAGDLLIAACANETAKVIDAADGREVATLAIGAGPDSVLYDDARGLAFIPCGRDGVLDVIAVRGPRDVALVQSVPTQVGARTGAVDPATGAVYLATAKLDPPAQPGGRPTAEPGTFEILVVTPAKGVR